MSTSTLKALGTATTTAGLYLFYDYKTCHPMRQMQYDPSEALVRLHNTIWRVLPTAVHRSMTLPELSAYNGQSSTSTYFGAAGTIYDATPSEMFATSYQQWAGRDATVALAKMSLSAEDVNRTDIWKDLTPSEEKSLQSWTDYFDQKYYIKGQLAEYYQDTTSGGGSGNTNPQ